MRGTADHKAVDPAPVGEHTSLSRRRHHTSEPAGALRFRLPRHRRPVDELRCDPLQVERGTKLVEASAREEGRSHARAGRMRIKTIPKPFVMAYVDGYLDEWMKRNPVESDDA